MPFALVTGASAGLGEEFARQLAARRTDLVLVARSATALDALAAELRETAGVAIEVIAADLTEDAGIERVVERLRSTTDRIQLLVNNAGYGIPQDFADNNDSVERAHLAIHVEAPMRLMHAALSTMRGRGGRILNVASIAGFLPRSTYAAHKAWVINFSRWANVAYRPDRVTVTALCPGFVHTQFHARMGMAAGHEGVPKVLWLNAPDVVRTALSDAGRGRSVSIPSLRYTMIRGLVALLPATLTARLGQRGRM